MQRIELELEVGETVQIGNRYYTLIDTHGDEMSLRVDSADGMPLLEEDCCENELAEMER